VTLFIDVTSLAFCLLERFDPAMRVLYVFKHVAPNSAAAQHRVHYREERDGRCRLADDAAMPVFFFFFLTFVDTQHFALACLMELFGCLRRVSDLG